MAILQISEGYNKEDGLALARQDIGAIVDELNKGLDPAGLPDGRITSTKLRLRGVTGAAVYMGTVANNSWGNIFLGVNTATGKSDQKLGNLISSFYIDWYVSPAGVSPTSPTLKDDLIAADGKGWPYSNGRQGTGGTSFFGLGGGAALNVKDQINPYAVASASIPTTTATTTGIAAYNIAVHNLTGSAQDFFFILSFSAIAQATFA